MNKALWIYTRGLGDSLLYMNIMTHYAKSNKFLLYLYPYYIESKYRFPKQCDIFTRYLLPKYDYSVIEYNDLNISDFVVSNRNHGPLVNDKMSFDINSVKMTDKWHEFDEEFNEYDKEFSIKNRVAIHLRFNNSFEVRNIAHILSYMNRNNEKYIIATDNIDILNKKFLPLVNKQDIVLLPFVDRGTSHNDIELPYSLEYLKNNPDIWIENKIQALKEAYFLSYSKYYISSTGLYSTVFIPFLRKNNDKNI